MVEMMRGGQDRAIAMALYVITALYMVLIFYLSSLTTIEQPGPLGGLPQVDKLEHSGEFFFLGLLLSLAFQYTPSPTVRRTSWALAILVAVLYAASDEMHQFVIPGRSTDALDLLADTAGIALASLIGEWLRERRAIHPEANAARPIPHSRSMQDSEE